MSILFEVLRIIPVPLRRFVTVYEMCDSDTYPHIKYLWCTITWISILISPMEITPVSTTFCWDYPCEHYFLWRLPLWALLLCSITHYDITMGNDIARNVHCDITMSNDIAMCTYHDITMHNDVAMNLLLCITMPNYNFFFTVYPFKLYITY